MDMIFEEEQSCSDYSDQPLTNMPFKQVMDCLSAKEINRAHEICTSNRFRPKLGQLLIASGRLSATDLDSMLVVHECEGMKNVPMGKLLVVAGLLSGDELTHYFELQKLLKFPSRRNDSWGQKLVSDGLLTQDQLNTLLEDQTNRKCSLKQAIHDRGWLSEAIETEANAAELEDQPRDE